MSETAENKTKNKTKNIVDILEVTAPYLAFSELTQVDTGVWRTELTPEQPRHNELGVIPACEVGRHLALLGAAATALQNPASGKHFYLATTATIENHSSIGDASSATLIAQGKQLGIQGKQAMASATLHTPMGEHLFSLSIGYQIISSRVFERMFKAHLRLDAPTETPLDTRSVYARPLEIEAESLSTQSFVSHPYEVLTEHCAGHFPNYPCLPVAILMGHMARSAGAVLSAQLGVVDLKYRVVHGDIIAQQLAFAGSRVRFEANSIDYQAPFARFDCRALDSEGKAYGEMIITLEHEPLEETA